MSSAFFVREGSLYNPGWEVVEEICDRQFRVLATFVGRSDAEVFCSTLDIERNLA